MAGDLTPVRLGPADLALVEALEASAGWPLGGSPERLAATLGDEALAVFGLRPAAGESLAGDAFLKGYAIVARLPFEAELQAILVAEAYRRRGGAASLMRAVIAQARAWGSERLLLEVRAGNAAAIALYRRVGFGEDGRRRGYYPPAPTGGSQTTGARDGAPREDALLMSHPLGPGLGAN